MSMSASYWKSMAANTFPLSGCSTASQHLEVAANGNPVRTRCRRNLMAPSADTLANRIRCQFNTLLPQRAAAEQLLSVTLGWESGFSHAI